MILEQESNIYDVHMMGWLEGLEIFKVWVKREDKKENRREEWEEEENG